MELPVVAEKFIKYVKIDTQSREELADKVPSTEKQRDLAKLLYQELKDMGVNVVSVSLDNDRDKWLKALNEDQVSWLQLVDLDGFEKSKVRKKITSVEPNPVVSCCNIT